MTENPKEYHPDFNEFWDELISKSEWAKENAGKISIEFKNLGVLQPKPAQQQKQADPPPAKSPIKSTPTTIEYMQKVLMWLVIIIFSFLVATLVFNLATQPSRIYCVLHQVSKGFLGQNCTNTILVPEDRIILGNNVNEQIIVSSCPDGEILNQNKKTCESIVEPTTDPNATTSDAEPGKNQVLKKNELKASVIKSLLN